MDYSFMKRATAWQHSFLHSLVRVVTTPEFQMVSLIQVQNKHTNIKVKEIVVTYFKSIQSNIWKYCAASVLTSIQELKIMLKYK